MRRNRNLVKANIHRFIKVKFKVVTFFPRRITFFPRRITFFPKRITFFPKRVTFFPICLCF